MPSPEAVVLLLAIGAAALVIATRVALRAAPDVAERRVSRAAPLVPWIGTALTILLLVRGSFAGAGFVAGATLIHAVVARWRAVGAGRRSGGEG